LQGFLRYYRNISKLGNVEVAEALYPFAWSDRKERS